MKTNSTFIENVKDLQVIESLKRRKNNRAEIERRKPPSRRLQLQRVGWRKMMYRKDGFSLDVGRPTPLMSHVATLQSSP